MQKRLTMLVAILLLTLPLRGQSHLGTWNILNGRINFPKGWSAFFEAQLRSLRFYDHYFYHEQKVGVSYDVNRNFGLTVGMGRYTTHSEGGDFEHPIINFEHRTWLQLAMKHPINRLQLEHRYRIEKQWTSSGYRNRFRYRVNLLAPLNNPTVVPGTIFLSVFDEVFFRDEAPWFIRNRVFAGAGYKVSKPFTLLLGWIRQYDYRIEDPLARNFLQLSMLFEGPWSILRHKPPSDSVD
jgi:hypothetical protein